MGCDGGTIPRRDELVRQKQKPEQKDKNAERQFRWLHCAISQQRLQQPIVMCGLGRLYSKQSVLEYLLDKEKQLPEFQHIKSMKDIKDLKLSSNPAYKSDDNSVEKLDSQGAPFVCKLIGLEMSGKFRFVALWSCGCVFSERALKELNDKVCALCQTPFTEQDVVILNGSDEEMEEMRTKMAVRSKKRKRAKAEASSTTEAGCSSVVDSKKSGDGGAKDKIVSINREKTLDDPTLKKLKIDYSVAKDPKASSVYKSLFTTHSSEQEQSRAHWVTYNPFYN